MCVSLISLSLSALAVLFTPLKKSDLGPFSTIRPISYRGTLSKSTLILLLHFWKWQKFEPRRWILFMKKQQIVYIDVCWSLQPVKAWKMPRRALAAGSGFESERARTPSDMSTACCHWAMAAPPSKQRMIMKNLFLPIKKLSDMTRKTKTDDTLIYLFVCLF